ncbi:MAG: SDR family NAD(P)-dependent oxidoreductase [Bacteroidales bacterium]|nr:SDR family NAD(P)-dependent oxidoreductase [Candidatus Cryptobacteroides choladohippi]MCQ2180298.1 SDR family NAD(P)-dependent oxidoreductase [Bacteroidales bacterium]
MKVWITGASSGIGEACAYEYAAQGACLVLTASSADRLQRVADGCMRIGAGGAVVLPFDLQDASGIDALCQQAWEAFSGLDILFCNAGVSQRTRIEDTSMETIRKIMEINFFAPVAISKAILPLMLSQGGGKIAVTSSIAGRFGFPLRCGYSSSKFALYGFFETLAAEHREIDVTMVCPGRVQTNISMNALVEGGARYGKMDPGQAGGLDVKTAARRITRAISKGKREVLVGRKELLMVYIKRFFPGLCSRLARKLKPV